LPAPLITDTERIGLSVIFITIAVLSAMSALTDQRPAGRVETLVPQWVYYEWTLTLFLGGVFTILGIWNSRRMMERFGISLALVGCFTYGLALVTIRSDNPRIYISGTLFLLLALVKLIRLMVSTAAAATQGDE
jgi:hypothetical protein